jgi:hypothetical protein
MIRQHTTIAVLLVLAFLLLAGVAYGATVSTYTMPWWALAGGNMRVSADSYTLDSTLGQGIAGPVSAGTLSLCAGYQCAPPGKQIYLPAVLKNH